MRLLHKLIFSLLRGLTCVRDMLLMINTVMHWLMTWHDESGFGARGVVVARARVNCLYTRDRYVRLCGV